MKKSRSFPFLLLLLTFVASYVGSDYVLKLPPSERYVEVVNKTLPTSVSIYVFISRVNKETKQTQIGKIGGSGVFISANGHILTCNHLFNHGYKIEKVIIADYYGHEDEATILYQDDRRDLALVKIERNPTPYSVVARPDAPKVGQEVIAIGTPLGFEGTVTTGVISALNRDFIRYDMIQMSAAINPGNSGGPLFNLKGEIVGINTNIVSQNIFFPTWSGLGFAVSASEINKFLTMFKGLKVR